MGEGGSEILPDRRKGTRESRLNLAQRERSGVARRKCAWDMLAEMVVSVKVIENALDSILEVSDSHLKWDVAQSQSQSSNPEVVQPRTSPLWEELVGLKLKYYKR